MPVGSSHHALPQAASSVPPCCSSLMPPHGANGAHKVGKAPTSACLMSASLPPTSSKASNRPAACSPLRCSYVARVAPVRVPHLQAGVQRREPLRYRVRERCLAHPAAARRHQLHGQARVGPRRIGRRTPAAQAVRNGHRGPRRCRVSRHPLPPPGHRGSGPHPAVEAPEDRAGVGDLLLGRAWASGAGAVGALAVAAWATEAGITAGRGRDAGRGGELRVGRDGDRPARPMLVDWRERRARPERRGERA